MNNDEGKFKGIDFFNGKCIDNCFNRFLSEEIRIIEPKVIFCFGSSVLNNFSHRFKNKNNVLLKILYIFGLVIIKVPSFSNLLLNCLMKSNWFSICSIKSR